MSSSRSLVRRLLLPASIVAAVALIVGAVALQPAWHRWRRTALLDRLAAAAQESGSDQEVRRLVDQLGRLLPDSIEALAVLSATQRAAAAQTAQDALDVLTGQWEILPEAPLDEEIEQQMQRLGEALAAEIDRFGPQGRLWVESILLQLIDKSEGMTPRRAAALLAACDHALARLAAPEDLRPVLAPTALPRPTTVSLPTPAVDVTRLESISTEAAWAPAEQPESTDIDPFQRVAPLGPTADSDSRPTPTPLAWQRRSVVAHPLPASTPSEATPSGDNAQAKIRDESADARPVAPTLPKPVDIPSPQLVRRMARQYRSMSTAELEALAPTTNRYVRRVVDAELETRRLARGQRASEPTTPTPAEDPDQRVRAAQLLPASEARRELRRLVDDGDPRVRLEALSALATTDDPHLDRIARHRAAADEDARVARLASEILERLER